jgi:hypothetical protein
MPFRIANNKISVPLVAHVNIVITSTAFDIRLQPGAGDVNRTHDLLITNQLLYQLSYAGL